MGLKPAFLQDRALLRVWDVLPEARVVGGAVRDALIGLPVADIDLATPREPDSVRAAVEQAGLRAVPTGLDHGTITTVADGRPFEVTTLRRDVATDGRHATVAFTDDWREDAARRDFTFNAMSMTRDGTLFDPFGGAADLAAGRVRFVGDATTRIAEDYLRILRYFRFRARYGTQEPDSGTLAALRAGAPGMARLSPERVWSELKRILAAPDPSAAVELMGRLGVLRAAIPEGASPAQLARLVRSGAPPDPMLRLAALLDGDAEALADRLRLSGAERELLIALRGTPPPPDASDLVLRQELADTAPDILAGRAWLAGDDPALPGRIAAMPPPVFPLQGRDLLAAGIPAGPGMGNLLRELREWWRADGCVADINAMRRELARRGGD